MSELKPPGFGLPSFERSLLNFLLKTGSALLSDRRVMSLFLREAKIVTELVESVDYDFASQPVLVPRFQGMEDSSRNWSLFMVLDHLCRVDREIIQLIGSLSGDSPMRGEVDIASYKPDPDSGVEKIEEFQIVVAEYEKTIREQFPLRNTPRFPHPWFGPLDAHGWHSLAAVHHRIHRKQARKIVALLGQT